MAETATHGFSDTQKFCFEYFEKNTCKRLGCNFIHKKKSFIEVVQVKAREGFVIGRCSSIPLCRYFLRGYCTHAGNCRFRHEIKPIVKVPLSNNNHSSSTNTPSTSGSEVSNKDTTSLKNKNNEVSDAGASTETTDIEMSEMNNSNKESMQGASYCSPSKDDSSWVYAPEFFPKSGTIKPLSYAAVVNPGSNSDSNNTLGGGKQLCPYTNKDGFCKYPPGECNYLHGNICDLCGNAALHPEDEEQRKKHHQDCIKQHEKNMELSFAIARSKEKSCGICFEVIMEKANGEQRFGILPNCNHCFCLSCIRKWRQARQFENKIIRACPECRVTSDFVCPSIFWVDTKEDKNKLIDEYKSALSTKDCKYFDRGNGKCPFGNKCFYRHALADGRVCDVGPPPRQRRARHAYEHSSIEVLQQVILWDFFDEREHNWPSFAEDFEDLADLFSDSDDSDWSDYELFTD